MKILFLLPRFPYPLEKGDKLRAYHQIKTLAERHEVSLFVVSHTPVDECAIDMMRSYCSHIEIYRIGRCEALFNSLLGGIKHRSIQVSYWTSRRALKRFRQFEQRVVPDVVYAQMVRMYHYLESTKAVTVLDFQDCLSLNYFRRASYEKGIKKCFFHYEAQRLVRAEIESCNRFDGMTIISHPDRANIMDRLQKVHLQLCKPFEIVRNGVETDYFAPRETETKEYDLVFCGNMQYAPNVDAAHYLVEEIMPLVWQKEPCIRILLAGATPKRSVRQLAEEERVFVSGTVVDIRDCYAKARIFIAPMRLGSGLQNKLLEAMSMHLPCITTAVANDSLKAEDGTHLLVGNTKEELAEHIITLLNNSQLCDDLVQKADAYIQKSFSWNAVGRQLETLFNQLIKRKYGNTQS